MQIVEETELIMLNKALMLARFFYNDYDSKDFYGSPITGELHQRVIDELRIKLSEKMKYMESASDFSIDNRANYIENVKRHISNIDNWCEFSYEIRNKMVHNFIFPFTLKEETIKELTEYTEKEK